MKLTIKTAEDRRAEALTAQTARLSAAVAEHVEAQARALHYSSAALLASYAGSTVPDWAAEAQAFIRWRDAVWSCALDRLAAAEASGTLPSRDDLIAALPPLAARQTAPFAKATTGS